MVKPMTLQQRLSIAVKIGPLSEATRLQLPICGRASESLKLSTLSHTTISFYLKVATTQFRDASIQQAHPIKSSSVAH